MPARDWVSLASRLLQHLVRNQSFRVLEYGRKAETFRELTEMHHQEWSLRLNLTQHEHSKD